MLLVYRLSLGDKYDWFGILWKGKELEAAGRHSEHCCPVPEHAFGFLAPCLTTEFYLKVSIPLFF